MDDQNLGTHCSYCNQKDWIPLECKYCHQKHCYQHSDPYKHNCPSRDDEFKARPPAPNTNNLKYIPPDTKYDKSRIIITNTPIQPSKIPAEKSIVYICASCNLRLNPLNYYYCGKCDHYFCLEHRLPELHKCGTSVTQEPSSWSCSIF